MDEKIAKWIIEYLVRQSKIDENIINGVISVLPLTNIDNRLAKSRLLRKIEIENSNGSISEKTLDLLEIIEELDHREGTSVSKSMKLAYCAVAVDITVRFLDADIENNEKYLETVRKVWIDRVQLKESFMSEELKHWMGVIEDSVKDLKVQEKILMRNTRYEALEAVRVYLKEAWGCIGPTFLELVAEKFGNVFDSVECHGGGGGGGCGVVENNPCCDLVPYGGLGTQPTWSKHNLTKSKHHRGAKLSSTYERIEDESMNESKRHSGDEPNEDESLNKSKRCRGDEGSEDERMNKRKCHRGHEGNEHESINMVKTAPTPEPDTLQAPSSIEHNASIGPSSAGPSSPSGPVCGKVEPPTTNETTGGANSLSRSRKNSKDVGHFYKSKLHTYAQKRNLLLPSYMTEREGPPHLCCFKSKVTIDGKTYECPEYFSTIKDAENAAAKVALAASSSDGNEEEDRIFYKNLLQELAQKQFSCLPKYSTLIWSLGNSSRFISTVEVKSESFTGKEEKTKKLAELDAARVAYIALKEGANQKANESELDVVGPEVQAKSANLCSVFSQTPSWSAVVSNADEPDRSDLLQRLTVEPMDPMTMFPPGTVTMLSGGKWVVVTDFNSIKDNA